MKNARRKIMAVLAGGLMLGVGATVTLAAWNDSEFAASEFSSGSFGIEGSVFSLSGQFLNHATAATAAGLVFTLDDGKNLSPGDVLYAPFWVRIEPNSSYNNASLSSTAVTVDNTTGTNAANLAYQVHSIPAAATCNAASAAAGTLVASGSTLDTHTPAQAVPLTRDGPPIQLCFVVTASPDLQQNGATKATWTFRASTTS